MNKKLPKGWMWTRLEEISDLIRGVTYKKVESSKEPRYGYLPILRANNINKELIFNDIVYVPQKTIKKEQYIKAYDILIAMSSGSKHLVGKAAQAFEDFNGSFGTFCGLIRPFAGINKRFFGLFFQSLFYTSEISKVSMGVNINNLRRSNIESLNFPLLPLPEQKLIVEKIEELFSNLDAGVEALEKVKKQLKRYRQAVLKAAFEGKLTAEWRQRMLSEEKKELKKYKIENADLPKIPESWNYLTLPQIVKKQKNSIKRGPFGSTVKKEYFVPFGYKIYEQKNAIYNDFNLGNYCINDIKFQELKDFEVKPGDIIMSCSGTIGRLAIVPENAKKGIINQALLKITLNKNVVNTNFFIYLFRSKIDTVLLNNVRGSAMMNIASVKELKKFLFPIPNIDEQKKIVEEIEKRFGKSDEVEKKVDDCLKQAQRLRQSILREAFNGNLTKEWREKHINELEPAEKLLERIKKKRNEKIKGEQNNDK